MKRPSCAVWWAGGLGGWLTGLPRCPQTRIRTHMPRSPTRPQCWTLESTSSSPLFLQKDWASCCAVLGTSSLSL